MTLRTILMVAALAAQEGGDRPEGPLRLSWTDEMLTIAGPALPGDRVEVWYLEAFCRAGSTDREWDRTVIPHETHLVEASGDGRALGLRSTLADGVVVDHRITAGADAVRFEVVARNPTDRPSEAHWAQPCIRVDRFTGTEPRRASEAYLPHCFIVPDGRVEFMPTEPWATGARYVPGQVWGAPGVPRDDLNPRPINPRIPSDGLIGCTSADGSMILATAWEPYQELFQGVIVCLHADFRIGGLAPGESKRMRGIIYLVEADTDRLLERYRRDFPEHRSPPD